MALHSYVNFNINLFYFGGPQEVNVACTPVKHRSFHRGMLLAEPILDRHYSHVQWSDVVWPYDERANGQVGRPAQSTYASQAAKWVWHI